MICPECGSNKQQAIGHETICPDCGLVLEDSPLRHEPLERAPASHPALSIAGTKHDGRIVKSSWLLTTKQKNLQVAKRQIKLIASRLKLPDSVETEAMLLFEQASQKGLTRGRDNQSLTYASIYAACQLHDLPKTPLEVTAFTGVSRVKMLRSYRLLARTLGLRLGPVQPLDLLNRFASRLHLSPQTQQRAAEILENARIPGCRPETLVAAALYLAAKECGEPRTQRQIANTTGVIEVTIRAKAKNLQPQLQPNQQ